MSVDKGFSSVPVLDYSFTKDPSTRPEFLSRLRDALINVGFLYLSNPPVSRDDIDLVIDLAPKLFTLPQEKKNSLLMRNNLHFLGYTRIGAEYTKGEADQREQYDFATPYECRWAPGAPEYLKLWGPAQVSTR
jgi:isopenicillin N synthase-like dioxygenase